ncbi:D-lactate dehydrogenase [Lactobacillus colini]|uniref:D-lactate dehydrogenase n=1 Tax=Lactobacillus colini TaxID=1819254 RepID=A0ABS4MCJ9_9LACO|nr:D-2-hydroxyacid dehydrogenase [Lactobacillus colini]MBP2057412.1 D-lactate dehydrogenase [Lactobacillus colini]
MRIAMFNPSESERAIVKGIAAKQGIEVKLVDDILTPESVVEAKDCDGISILQTVMLDQEEVYRTLHDYGIKSIGLRSVGTNTIDFDLAKKYDLIITHVPVYSPRAIAEMAVTQAMYLVRKIGLFHEHMDKDYDFSYPTALISDEIYNKTIGLIGVGNIGSAVAQIFSALGAKVIAYDVIYNPANEPFLTYADFDTVIKEADVISLHTPLLPSTKNMISTKQFEEMKNTAYLINVARGGLIDTDALIKALQEEQIAGAGLDTLADEATYFGKKVRVQDIPEDYKILRAMPNVIITPHSAYFTETAVKNMVKISLEDTVRIAEGKKPLFAANK